MLLIPGVGLLSEVVDVGILLLPRSRSPTSPVQFSGFWVKIEREDNDEESTFRVDYEARHDDLFHITNRNFWRIHDLS